MGRRNVFWDTRYQIIKAANNPLTTSTKSQVQDQASHKKAENVQLAGMAKDDLSKGFRNCFACGVKKEERKKSAKRGKKEEKAAKKV